MFNSKKRYFKNKLDGVQKMLWDLEFKRYKTLEIREDVRKEYDNSKARLEVLIAQITSQKENPTMEQGEVARLDDQRVLLERDIERYAAQMKGLDLEVAGSKPTAEYQDGVIGINHQIDSLQELRVMLEDYISSI